jgi:hypothetical protein
MLITCAAGPITLGFQYYVFLNLGSDVVNKMRVEAYQKLIKLPL